MEEKKGLKDLITRFKQIKNIELILAILVISIVISIYISTIDKPSEIDQNEYDQNNETSDLHWIDNNSTSENRDEQRLKEILSAIKGAGKVEVMITYSSGKEIIPAMNTVESTTITEEEDNNGGTRKINQTDKNFQPSTYSDSEGSKPIILKEVEPEIKGVIIIAQGAEDVRVKMELMRAVQVALGIKPSQVEVFPMEQGN
ncbi:MAG: hypothetical protein WBI74_09540 [Caldicoprobacterales bacterium]|nr:stage III sporulation protein AG [Clostridiales bacterium]